MSKKKKKDQSSKKIKVNNKAAAPAKNSVSDSGEKRFNMKYFWCSIGMHIAAGILLILVAEVILHSFVTVSYIDGDETYYLNPISSNREQFTESQVYTQILTKQAQDIMTYVACRNVLENGGSFDSRKRIDVTEWAEKFGELDDCNITAFYSLQDLINWGKQGFEYTERTLSMADFVGYFDRSLKGMNSDAQEKYLRYLSETIGENFTVVTEPDGMKMVHFNQLSSEYQQIDGANLLTSDAGSWEQYFKLERNLTKTATELARCYDIYRAAKGLYGLGKCNINYTIRIREGDSVKTYTNDSDYIDSEDESLTEITSENMQYLIYFPETLEYTGMTAVSEGDLYRTFRLNSYGYPDSTRIWMYLDMDFSAEEDGLTKTNLLYTRSNESLPKLLIVGGILLVAWISLALYVAIHSGRKVDEQENIIYRLNRFDHLWTEFQILLIGCSVALIRLGVMGLTRLVNHLFSFGSIMEAGFREVILDYTAFCVFGLIFSILSSLFMNSLFRRLRGGNLYKDSLLHLIVTSGGKVGRFVGTHSSLALSTLIPYNLVVIGNVVAVFFAGYFFKTHPVRCVVVLLAVTAVDAIIGVWLFRFGAERRDILVGIRRIRDGETEYKLNTEHLTGTNQELAEAVNTIGDGISKAVSTSMKDEKMKSDLITNVSHDLKTPLTSIINYVNLLQRENITAEPAAGYISVLDDKSKRLKQLLEDLLEASRISSGNLELQIDRLNLTELSRQAAGEFEDRLTEQALSLVFDMEPDTFIYADSRRIWRVVDNLLLNVCKYAMSGTRVYISLHNRDGRVSLAIKNVSAKQSKYQGQELTERFIRGDESRTTEGSGLGLYIAKSLTELQGGTFDITMDGDLFTAVMTFDEADSIIREAEEHV